MKGEVAALDGISRNEERSPTVLPVSIAAFLELFNITAFSAALAPIALSFGASFSSVRFLTVGYSVSVAVLLPLTGWLCDAMGARRTFVIATILFCTGCLLCFVAPSVSYLAVGRAVQGLGCAFLVPVGRISLARELHGPALLRVLSGIAVPAVVGSTVGPLVGGFLVDSLGWRYLFLFMLFVGIMCSVTAWAKYVDDGVRERRSFDFISYVLLAIAIASGLMLLSLVRGQLLSSVAVTVLAVSFVGSTSIFAARCALGAQRLLDLKLFCIASFRAAAGAGNISRLGISGVPLLFAYGLQTAFAYSALVVGGLLSLQALGALFTKRFAVRIIEKYGYGSTLTVNTAVLGISILSLGFIFASGNVVAVVIGLCAYGMTSSLQFSCLNTLVYRDLSPESKSAGACLSGTLMQLAVSTGIALAFAMAQLIQFEMPTMQWVDVIALALKILGSVVLVSAVNFTRLRQPR